LKRGSLIVDFIKMLNMLTKLNIRYIGKARKKVFVYRKSHIGLEGNYHITNEGSLHLGFTDRKNPYFQSYLTLRNGSRLRIKGNVMIGTGHRISINKDAALQLGSGFINYNINIACFNKITIGDNVVISENVTIRDSDNHELLYDGYEMSKPVTIGNHVWIGMNVTILKGVTIGDGAVIAAGSVVTRDISPHCLAAGVPAKVIKENVRWK
jgi:acetyltransferase-like isoleucine patch superfamily enzyme